MYLKSLELHGFKSFPDRTVLKFSGGTTVIVGPNGSGKSNITDAMRWVLGELSSKNIRGSKMEDVIFAGADDVKPMSFAEVSVTFDDSREPRALQSPYDEVTVTRRYYRSGESEYFINRRKCRLKDIYELFMNTGIGREGYSIIGQGRIAEIISKKSEDRRGIFEESAGISRFRYKKTESEKKLAETEANMERVADIEAELAARVGPLEKEAAKARKYLELYAEKKKCDVALWLYDAGRLKKAIEKSEGDTALSAHELEMAEDSLKVTSGQIERLYEQSRANKETSRRNHEATSDAVKRMNAAESDARILRKEKQHAEAELASENQLIESAESSRRQKEEKLAALTERAEGIARSVAEAEEEYAGYTEQLAKLDSVIREKDRTLEEKLTLQKNAEGLLTDLRVRLNVLEISVENQKKRSESIGADLGKYEAEIAECDRILKDAGDQIEAYKKAAGEIAEKLAGSEKEIAGMRAEADGTSEKIRAKQAEIDSLDSRIRALSQMQEHFDGYNNSVRFIMNEAKAGRLGGIRGPVSTLISVDKKYIAAIETTLGNALQNIVTDDENTAKAAIEALKRGNAGRATFYPVTTVRPAERGREYDAAERARGFLGWGDELASSAPEYRNIVKSLLARLAVFDTLDNATEAARASGWRIRAVTLDGQQINAGGSFTGGVTKRDSGMLSRASLIASMKKERSEAAKEQEGLRAELKSAEEKIAAAARDNEGEEERRKLFDALRTTEEKTYADADGRRRTLTELTENMKRDALAMTESGEKSAEEIANLRSRIADAEAEAERIRSEREEIAGERGEAELEAAEIGERANEVRIRLAWLTSDQEAAAESIRETGAEIREQAENAETRRTHAKELAEKIAAVGKEAEEREKEAEGLRAEIDSLGGRQKTLDETGDEIDARLAALRRTEQEQTSKKELTFIAHSKNEARLASLKEEEKKSHEKLWDDYELTWATAERFAEENDVPPVKDGERTARLNEQNELKGKMRSLGHVNVGAVDEYNEVKTRYETIKAQLTDLRESREDLEKVIRGIEEDMKRMFLEAFGRINAYFGEVFRELFGGGHAEVILTDPDNALESGIEITAAPPGKTVKNLNLLSGGEQAFIAIALLFALIKVNPSPFCIFDEIEAALDEVNVGRVGRYVKNVSKNMQIIMISHRRGTMDIADTLYGVTMQKSGVSKVFTLGAGDDREQYLK